MNFLLFSSYIPTFLQNHYSFFLALYKIGKKMEVVALDSVSLLFRQIHFTLYILIEIFQKHSNINISIYICCI